MKLIRGVIYHDEMNIYADCNTTFKLKNNTIMSTGTDILNLAAQHIGERYILGAIAPKNNANYKGPWDCAEFVSWCVFQRTGLSVGMRNNDAYTGYWKDDIALKCTVISLDSAKNTAGAILLRYPNRATGHIVFSDGNGKTIEAMDKNNGVKRGKIDGRHWDVALLLNGVQYDEVENMDSYVPPLINFRFKNPIMRNPIILVAKQTLRNLGIDPGSLNNEYDQNMEIAVYNFQLTRGLVTDGIMGKKTLKSLKLT